MLEEKLYKTNEFPDKTQILSLIENANFERDRALRTLDKFKTDNKAFEEDYNTLKLKNTNLEQTAFENNKKKLILEQKLKENIDQLLSTERKLDSITNKSEMYERENKLLKNQLSHFESVLSSIKEMNKKQITELKRNLSELSDEKNELNNENISLKSEIQDIQLKLNMLKKENDVIKNDNEHLSQMLKEKIESMKFSEEKINSVDSLINTYKNEINQLTSELEKEKQLKNKEKIENNKLIENFGVTLKQKDETYDKAIEKLKKDFQQELDNQNDENEAIKSECLGYKIERDKFCGDFNILKEEYNKLSVDYQQQQIYIQNIQKETESYYQKLMNHLEDKNRLTGEENTKLENENIELKKQIRNLMDKNKTNQQLVMNDENVYNEMINIKKQNDALIQENTKLKQEIENLRKK